jgi:putative tricarboxylic transport membrane protein
VLEEGSLMKFSSIRIRSLDEVLVGAFLIVVAIFGLLACWHLRPGEISEMGPGYIPRLLLFLQMGLGAAILAQGFVFSVEPLQGWSLRAIFWILASIAFFTVTLVPLGLVVATMGLVALAGLANRKSRMIEVGIAMIVLTVGSVTLFVYALGLTIPVWPNY